MTPQSPSRASSLLGEVRRSVLALRESTPGTGAGGWAREVREEVVAGLDAVIHELTVYRGQVLLAQRADGHWGSVRDRDFADYRSRETGAGRGPALGELQLAEGLAQMPAVAQAVDSGELNLEHAKTLDRVRRGASPQVQGAIDAGALDELVKHAARDKLTAPELGKQARAWAAQFDAQAAQEGFDAVRRRRSLSMRNHAGGVKGEFFLDPVAGQELRTALDAITGRPAAADDRTREQRMADALSTMAGRTLQVGSDLNGAQVRPHLALLVTEETWTGVLAWRRRYESCPTDRPPLPDVPPAELEDGTLVPLRELERIMCDSEVTRMVMSADGVPLDVGRTQRTYTKELRRAITTRDRHCQWPGCTLRASWCEIHHITWFSRGGVTSIDEGITDCTFHHHLIHEHNVQITVLPDGFDFHLPDGTHIGTTRRATPPTPGSHTRRHSRNSQQDRPGHRNRHPRPPATGSTPDRTSSRRPDPAPRNRCPSHHPHHGTSSGHRHRRNCPHPPWPPAENPSRSVHPPTPPPHHSGTPTHPSDGPSREALHRLAVVLVRLSVSVEPSRKTRGKLMRREEVRPTDGEPLRRRLPIPRRDRQPGWSVTSRKRRRKSGCSRRAARSGSVTATAANPRAPITASARSRNAPARSPSTDLAQARL